MLMTHVGIGNNPNKQKKVTTKKLGMFRQKPSVLWGSVVGPVWSNGMSHCTSGWFDVSREKREGYCTLPTCNCIPQERRKTKQRRRKALHFCGGTFCFQMRDTGDQQCRLSEPVLYTVLTKMLSHD